MAQGEPGGKMRTSLTRLVAGTAIAATALLTVAGTASASTATPKKSTTLSIVAAKSKITVGQSDTISGTLASHKTPVAGRIVILDKRVGNGHWFAAEEKLTGKSGKVSFTVAPKVDTRYELVFKGGPVYKAAHSGVVLVVVVKPVVKTPTTLSATAATGSITAGSTDKVDGTLVITKDTKALPGQWVWLDTVANGKLHHLRAIKTGKYGKVAFTVKPAATTTYELQYLGTHLLAPSVSNTVTVTVTAAS
jgi:hypothetical protein